MRRARPALIAPSLIALLLVSSGCYGPYRSPYGGAYGNQLGNPYGGYPGAPVQTLQPGGTYTPSPYGQPVLPGGAFPQGTLGPSPTIDQTGGNAPFYGSGSSTQPPYDSGGVPTYSDPNEIQFKQPVQPDHTAVEEFGAVDGVSAETAGVAKVDLDTAHFVAPVMANAAPPQPTFAAVPAAPYAHDAEYQWLRGVLRFDASTGQWTMIYSDNPAAEDEHAGQLIVADSPALASFKPQAVVLLHGQIDTEQSAATGRAIYRVETAEPIEPSLR